MKPEIHPDYQPLTVTCACGATFETRSTKTTFALDICSKCHPFYTGTQKIMDTAGRIERFRKRYAQKQ
jgi:large subunit ribosomal protein L31